MSGRSGDHATVPESTHVGGVVLRPVLTVGWRCLAHRHLRHGPDLWFAGRDGDTLLGVVLVTVSVAVTKTMMAHVTSQVILSICNKY